MKKMFIMFTTVFLITTIVGCGKQDYESKGDSTTDNTSITQSDTSSTESYVHYPVTSSIRNDLTMNDMQTLYVGMPFEEVIKLIGAPHGSYGSGMVGDMYELAEGTKIVIYYNMGTVEAVKAIESNGQKIAIID